MEMLDAMQVGQRKGKPLSLFGRDQLIDIDRMNRLIALAIATTVAKRFPASSYTGEKNIRHIGHPCGAADASHMPSRGGRHHEFSALK
jgi:hypothetical protein